MTYGKKLRK